METDEKAMLASLRKQGGARFVDVVPLARAGDKQAAEELHDMAWEQLHSGPWHAVEVVWRDAYALSSFLMASCAEREGKLEEALKHLDKGLIMGGPLFRVRLEKFIASIQSSLSTAKRNAPERGRQEQLANLTPADFSTKESMEVAKGGNLVKDEDAKFPQNPALIGPRKRKDRPSGDQPEMDEEDLDAELSRSSEPNPYAEALQPLPAGSLSFADIDERSLPSLETFARDFLLPGLPVVIKDGILHWPAMQKWQDKDYLRSVAGNRTVPVEIGEHYLAPGWKQELMTLGELLTRSDASHAANSTSRPYLAQHALFDQIPELMKDIRVPDYCSLGGGELKSINAWVGPSGTVTPLHNDPHHNLLAQVVGQKYVRLYHSQYAEQLYPFSELMLRNSSQVDLDSPDYEKYPEALGLPAMDCILEEGEMLYIPPGWWHYVRAISRSFSVSFWWAVSSDDEDAFENGS